MPDRSYNSPASESPPSPYLSKNYELSGKVMLTAIIVLFFIVFLMVCFHLYLRCYLLRSRTRRHQFAPTRRRRTNIVFHVDPNSNPSVVPSRGLDAAVVKSLPLFVFSGKSHPDPVECAVCLSEFEENETGRTLPKCNHSFHVGCIDMWFRSHSTCPLCRSAVESAEFSVSVAEPDSAGPGSIPTLPPCPAYDRTGDCKPSSSISGQSKPAEIQIPVRDKSSSRSEESPASQSFRSPMSRMRSFKRILSRDRTGQVATPSGYGGAAESDIECGVVETWRPSQSE